MKRVRLDFLSRGGIDGRGKRREKRRSNQAMRKRAKQGIRIVLDKVGGEGNQGFGSVSSLSLSLSQASFSESSNGK